MLVFGCTGTLLVRLFINAAEPVCTPENFENDTVSFSFFFGVIICDPAGEESREPEKRLRFLLPILYEDADAFSVCWDTFRQVDTAITGRGGPFVGTRNLRLLRISVSIFCFSFLNCSFCRTSALIWIGF
jgi:hypothetical protein